MFSKLQLPLGFINLILPTVSQIINSGKPNPYLVALHHHSPFGRIIFQLLRTLIRLKPTLHVFYCPDNVFFIIYCSSTIVLWHFDFLISSNTNSNKMYIFKKKWALFTRFYLLCLKSYFCPLKTRLFWGRKNVVASEITRSFTFFFFLILSVLSNRSFFEEGKMRWPARSPDLALSHFID